MCFLTLFIRLGLETCKISTLKFDGERNLTPKGIID